MSGRGFGVAAVAALVALPALGVGLGRGGAEQRSAAAVSAAWKVTVVGQIGRPNFYFDRIEPVLNDHGQVAFMRAGAAVVWQNGKTASLATRSANLRAEATYPTAINNLGQVVGMAYCGECQAPPERPWVWRQGAMADLGVGDNPFNAISYPALNNRGQVVGMDKSLHPFLWQNGRKTDLSTLPGRRYGDAVAINDQARVIGRSYQTIDGVYGYLIGPRAFLWSRGKLTDIGALPGDVYSSADAINAQGEVIGRSYPRSAKYIYDGTPTFDWEQGRPFLWQNGKMTGLPGKDARVSGINGRGQVVGSILASGRRHAVLWHERKMIDLGVFPGRPYSEAVAINNRGQVIGTSYTVTAQGQPVEPRVFIWQSGKKILLPPPQSAAESEAVAINERSQILGVIPDSHHEPGTVLLWTR